VGIVVVVFVPVVAVVEPLVACGLLRSIPVLSLTVDLRYQKLCLCRN
jgi:hypothetical protein